MFTNKIKSQYVVASDKTASEHLKAARDVLQAEMERLDNSEGGNRKAVERERLRISNLVNIIDDIISKV